MIGRYAILASRIRQEMAEIERVVQHAERALAAADQDVEHHDLFLNSAALSLHGFYSGIERLLELIASTVDRSVPSTHDWHRELLRQMTLEVTGIRPRVLSEGLVATLDRYRRFRHVVRNVYVFELDPEPIRELAVQVRPAFVQTRTELEAFADVLQALSDQA